MNKLSVALIASMLSSVAMAKTTIEFPLTTEVFTKGYNIQLLADLNPELAKLKLPGFPKVAVFGKNDVPYAKKLAAMTDKAAEVLNLDLEGAIGSTYFYEPEYICYRGEQAEVKAIIDALMGPVFHEDQGLQAIRYGSVKFVYEMFADDFFETNAETLESDLENNPGEVKLWKNYKKNSTTVLVMSDLGPQGDSVELYATEIKPCK